MKVLNKSNFVTPKAKWAFTTRRVRRADVAGITTNLQHAKAGDLVLAEVLSIGSHKRLQLTTGRGSMLNVGDKVVLCCGDRYAPDQFEGFATLEPTKSDMLAGGGVIGTMKYAHSSMKKPTQLSPIGLLTDKNNAVVNISAYGLANQPKPDNMLVIGVVGASMNAGKTTTTASLAHGLCKAGYTVAGIKATGTGAYGDYNAMIDAGLDYVADFTDAGMPTTYLQPIAKIEQGLCNLLADAKKQGVEIAVVELADGIYQKETAALLQNSALVRQFDGMLFASGDAVSVVGGVDYLRKHGYEPLAVSGKVSLSPLATREAQTQTGVKIFKREELMDAYTAASLVDVMRANAPKPQAKVA